MSRRKTYPHYCLAARTLEVVGERWSLLIVRDLLRGPHRFSELLRTVGGITPRWLSLRLRELEEAGIVHREQRQGRKEVWYSLTPKGEDLRPVIEALVAWGMQHAMRLPLPGERIEPDVSLTGIASAFNARGVRLDGPRTWVLRLDGGRSHTLRFDGERWTGSRGGAPADVTVEAAGNEWMTFLMALLEGRARSLGELRIEGPPARVAEFLRTFGVPPVRAI
ncbi:MAG TPA: helix-turn-helix domain-containing protein [Dehalococcoidia bacterium]|nr:helix-turn-helix domain-containing protein [Dehalococcoidia bacterium]